jgi:hypothetical protein
MIALIHTVVFLSCIVSGSSFQQNLVLEGISLPVNVTPSLAYFPTLSAETDSNVSTFFKNYGSDIQGLAGKSKTDPATLKLFDDIHQHYVDFKIIPDLPNGYQFFGNNKNYENAPYLFRTNPFFFTTLRSGPGNTFEIDPFGKRGTTYFSQLMSCLSNTLPRVCATFDNDMNIIKMKVFNATNPKKELTQYTKEQAATFLLYQSAYFGQNMHANSHVRI